MRTGYKQSERMAIADGTAVEGAVDTRQKPHQP